jgi:hypothetical protein
LRQAYSALCEAVEQQRRPDPDAGPEAWVEEIHELRTLMTAAAQLVRSIDLTGMADAVDWRDADAQRHGQAHGLTPAQHLPAAQSDLAAAMDQLNQAADSLTGARITLTCVTRLTRPDAHGSDPSPPPRTRGGG